MTKIDPRRYSHERFDQLIAETVKEIQKLSSLKGGEYAGDDDRLANFRRNAQALGLPMESIWAVYCAKHWDAVMQYIQDQNTGKTRARLESIEGRVDDIIVYMILFKAMLDENAQSKDDASWMSEGPGIKLPIRTVPLDDPGDPRTKLTLTDMANGLRSTGE